MKRALIFIYIVKNGCNQKFQMIKVYQNINNHRFKMMTAAMQMQQKINGNYRLLNFTINCSSLSYQKVNIC